MSYPLIFFNSISGKLILNNSIDVATENNIALLTLMADTPVGGCVGIIEHTAIRVNSLYNTPITFRKKPIVDGIVLTPGRMGDVVEVANKYGCIYTSTLLLAPGNLLYLGKNGIITTTAPSIANGDIWSVKVGERINDHDFIFSPSEPFLLNDQENLTDTTLRFDQISESISYKGEALAGSLENDPVWRICKITMVDNDISILWVNGSASYTNKWSDRLSLVYL